MSQEIILAITYWLIVIVMLAGVVGALIPAIPGPSLIVIATIASGFIYGWTNAIIWSVSIAVVIFILCTVIDYLSGILGAQKAGASNWGQIGSMIGLGLGFFGLLPALPFGGPILGIFFGPFIGAVIGEFLYLKELSLSDRLKQSVIAGVGIVVGSVIGLIIQGLLALGSVLFFLITTFHLGIPGY